MIVPEAEQRLQQVGPAQERAVRRLAPPMTTWLPPPVPTWRPSSMNFSVARPTLARFLVELLGALDLGPVGRVDVDLDHAGVGGDGEVSAGADRAAAGSLPAPPGGPSRAAVASIGGGQASQSSAANSGGRKTWIRPSRGSTPSAVRTTPASPPADHRQCPAATGVGMPSTHARRRSSVQPSDVRQRLARRQAARAARTGRVPSAGSIASGVGPGQAFERQAEADRANRRGPGTCASAAEEPVAATASAARRPRSTRRSGSTLADRLRRAPARTRCASRSRSSGSASSRPRPRRWPAAAARARGSSGCPRRPGSPAPDRPAAARARRGAKSRGVRRASRRRSSSSSANSAGRARPARRPSRQRQCSAQRGSCSPGYCLPMRRSAARRPAPSAAAAGAAARSARTRLVGPSASVFHSARPGRRRRRRSARRPCVRRTSPAARLGIDVLAERPGSRCHCASVYGLVTRGVSRMRRDRHLDARTSSRHLSDQCR